VAVLTEVVARAGDLGLSHGELIITAIETTADRLPGLLAPQTAVGGGLFASRRPRPERAEDGPVGVMTYRLREGDFETLDALVTQFGAFSRNHLITTALAAFLAKA